MTDKKLQLHRLWFKKINLIGVEIVGHALVKTSQEPKDGYVAYVPLRELDIANQRIEFLRAGLEEIANKDKHPYGHPAMRMKAMETLDLDTESTKELNEGAKQMSCKKHTPSPSGYIQWHCWAEIKSKTHRQIKCDECGLYKIWVKK